MVSVLKIGSNISVANRLSELIANIKSIESSPALLAIETDLSNIKWITPLSILPLANRISDFPAHSIVAEAPASTKSYLNTINFPNGSDIGHLRPTQSYIPILKIPINGQNPANVDQVIGSYIRMVLDNFFSNGLQNGLVNVVGYFLSEMASNLREHSQSANSWIMSQYWDQSSDCEICLLDNGIGLAGAYRKANIQVASDNDAILNAIMGLSAKGKERGYGISTNIRLFTESELRGTFLIISGSAGYVRTYGMPPKLFQLDNLAWNGTIIMVKFKRPNQQVNIYDFAE